MTERQLCIVCNTNQRAINYKKGDRFYYRTMCDHCSSIERKKKAARWIKEGYKKKVKCEACGFVPKYPEQLVVYDNGTSFKTICLNCDSAAKIANKLELKNRDLKPDF